MDTVAPFRAFVSYCHADRPFAAWLQRRLETYRLPRRLAAGVATLPGQSPGRIGPVFRDRADLSAAEDLSEAVRDAIAGSSALVVVASPDAARSHWVGREIALFRELHPKSPVLVALARGEPADAMPEALRAGGAEPLAADFRREGDGRRLGFLKIVAGLTHLPLDALVQRDAQRRVRRVTAVTAGAALLVVIMALLLVMAVRARADSEHRRADAEGLIEFMLTDLRQNLKGVGRPDIMVAVNQRAMAYYGSQGDLSQLPDESLGRRARVLHAMGEDDQSLGRLDQALSEFKEAHRTTAAILAKKPQDPDRLFAHAQSEFYVGLIARKRNDRSTASHYWRGYLAQAQALARAEPAGVRGLMEQAYAWGNLCDLDLMESYDVRSAIDECSRSVAFARASVRTMPRDRTYREALANRLGALGNAYFAAKRFDQAFAVRDAEAGLVDGLLRDDPQNADYQMRRAWPDLARAHIWIERNQADRAASMIAACAKRFPAVFEGDTEVSDLLLTRLRAHLLMARALRALGRKYAAELALADEQQRQLVRLNKDFGKRGAAIRANLWP
jgi:hypothetical protein